MKILIIDSNKDICGMLAEHLVKCGHDCVCAINERNGLSLIQKENFDVVLLDLKNKEFSGYDVIDSLEKNGKLKENKIVVYTALNLSQLEIEGLLKRGVYSYLQKPVKLDVLLRTLEAMCRR